MEGSSSSRNNGSKRGQEPNLPIAGVMQIMDNALPEHAQVSDEAKEFMVQCISKFISHATGQAQYYCRAQVRKTITAEDILTAMFNLKLDNYVDALGIYLTRYREYEARRSSVPDERFVGRRVRRYTPPIPQRLVVKLGLGSPVACGPPFAEPAPPATNGRILAHVPMNGINVNPMAMRGGVGHVSSSSSSSENSNASSNNDDVPKISRAVTEEFIMK